MKWKIIAIIFIVLFLIETTFLTWAVVYSSIEERKNKECLYNVCSENYDAYYDDGICTCYDLDMYGEYSITETKLMG